MNQPKPKVLLIDDELQWREYFIKRFADDFEIIIATQYEDALKLLLGTPAIKLIVIDVAISPMRKVSPMGGINMISEIRTHFKKLPIVIFSSFPLNAAIPNYLGADVVFSKNDVLQHDLLSKKVNDLIKGESRDFKPESPETISEIKRFLSEELEKFTQVKEKTLSIPNEGNFELIKPLVGYKRDIEKRISEYGYSKNVFLMMKFRESNKDLSDYIIDCLNENGFNGVRADQNSWNITHNVYNPIAVLYCCKFGIALFDEPEEHQAYSANIAYELGIMHSQNKNCLILKHSSLPQLPFDLIKEIYHPYTKDLEVKKIILNWITQVRYSG